MTSREFTILTLSDAIAEIAKSAGYHLTNLIKELISDLQDILEDLQDESTAQN